MLRKLLATAFAMALACSGQVLAQSEKGGDPGPAPGGHPRVQDLFERLDRNHDGALTPDELQDRGRAMLRRLGKEGVTRDDLARLGEQRREFRQRHPRAFERLKECRRERFQRSAPRGPDFRRPGARRI